MRWESGTAYSLRAIHPMSHEAITHQLRISKFHRFAWFFLLTLIVAALLGFFGGEYTFRSSELTSSNGIEYPYLARGSSPVTWKLKAREAKELWLSSSLIDAIDVENVWPIPSNIKRVDKKLLLSFTQAPDEVILTVKPRIRGFVEGKVGSEREAYSVGFFAFP